MLSKMKNEKWVISPFNIAQNKHYMYMYIMNTNRLWRHFASLYIQFISLRHHEWGLIAFPSQPFTPSSFIENSTHLYINSLLFKKYFIIYTFAFVRQRQDNLPWFLFFSSIAVYIYILEYVSVPPPPRDLQSGNEIELNGQPGNNEYSKMGNRRGYFDFHSRERHMYV